MNIVNNSSHAVPQPTGDIARSNTSDIDSIDRLTPHTLHTVAKRRYSAQDLGNSPFIAKLRKEAESNDICHRHLGKNLQTLLGDISPLDGANSETQRKKMKSTMANLQLKVELAVVDEQGNVSLLDQRVFDEIYAPNFPAHEAIGFDTILASLTDRKHKALHRDGKRFTLCYTGLLPGESEEKAERRPVAFAQGGTLNVGDGKCANYAEYWATSKEFRGQGVLDTLMGFNSALSMALAKKESKEFIGTFWEMEPIGTGSGILIRKRLLILGKATTTILKSGRK